MNYGEGYAHGLKAALTGYCVTVGAGMTIQSAVRHTDGSGNGSGYAAAYTAGAGQDLLTNVFANGEEWIHVAWRGTGSIEATVATFYRGGTVQFTVSVLITGAIQLRRGSVTGTIVATSAAGIVPFNVFHWFWIRLVAQDVAGTCEVRLNGAAVAAVSFVGDTRNAAADGWDQLYWIHGGASGTMYVADAVTFSAAEKTAEFGITYPELFIPGIQPTADFVNSFVVGGFGNVDEIPWTVADFATANAVNQELICSNAGLGWTPSAVHGVIVTADVERDGVVTAYQGRLVSGAADVNGPSSAAIAAGQFSERQWFWQLDPDGGIPWTWAKVVASKFGVETV